MTTQNRTIFAPVEAFIREEDHTDASLMHIIGNFIGIAPAVAQAMSFHARDILEENAAIEMSYSDVIVEVYFRTFFSDVHAPKYGTGHTVDDPVLLHQLAQTIVNPSQSHNLTNAYQQTARTSH